MLTEFELRKKIQQECLDYRTNFRGIDSLMIQEHNYTVAAEVGNYQFEGCPNSYDCLEQLGVTDLCECKTTGDITCEDCYACWRRALQGVNGDV